MIEWSPFSPKALDFIQNSTARINIAHGAVRSSKTIACTIRWLNFIATGPKGDLAMFGKTMATLQRNVLNDIFDIVGPKNYHWVNRQSGELILLDRRVYCFGANNEEAEAKIRGATFAGALCDEVNLYPQSVFTQLLARMSIKGAQLFCNCNPDSPYHWFYTDYITNEKLTSKKVWQFLLEDNYSLDPEYVENLKHEYTGVWYERMINGNWVVAEGLVYDMFKPEKNMIDTQKFLQQSGLSKKAIKWIVGCDYGTSTVMTWGLFARLPNGVLLKVKEYYYNAVSEKAQKTDSEFAEAFDAWVEDYPIWCVYVDPSAASWKVELMRRGYRVLNANNDVVNGIREVAAALNLGEFYIDISCENTLKEYGTYSWDPVAQRQGKDKPLKVNDHTCDADRYVVYTDRLHKLSGVYN